MKILASIALIAALPLAAQGPASWETSLDVAIQRAKAEKKQIFLDLWAEWCSPCQRLKRDVFPAPAAQAALRKTIPLEILVQKRDRTPLPEGTKLAERFRLDAYPTLFILDANGKEVRRHVGYLEPEALARFIEGKK